MIGRLELLRVLAVGADMEADFLKLVSDATRYRRLRECHWTTDPVAIVANPKQAIKLGHDCLCMNRLDFMVDGLINDSHKLRDMIERGEAVTLADKLAALKQ